MVHVQFMVNFQIGEQKDTVRVACRSILSTIVRLYPASKLFALVQTAAVGGSEQQRTRNARQKAECVEQLALLIEMNGLAVCQPIAVSIEGNSSLLTSPFYICA